jgi:ribosomal protein S25
MNTKQIDAQIQERVESFVADLTDLIHAAAVAAVQEAIAGAGFGAPSARATRTTKKRASKKRSSTKSAAKKATKKAGKKTGKERGRPAAAPNGPAMDKILTFVKANPGSAVGAIVAGTRVPSAAAKKAVAHMLDAGSLRKTGQRRGTKYFAK